MGLSEYDLRQVTCSNINGFFAVHFLKHFILPALGDSDLFEWILTFCCNASKILRHLQYNYFYIYSILITFNNPLKTCFSNNKYLNTIQTRPTQIVKVYSLFKTGF